MKKFLDQSSWRTALGNLLPSAHGHQGGSRKAAIGSMLIMAFAFVGCDDSSSASAGQNDEPAVESSSSSSGKVTEPDEVTSSSSLKSESSSSVGDSQSSSSKDPELAEGFLTDPRDGQTYKTVTIGTQTWMAENLNYGTANSDCYNDNSANCTKYGRLYTWAAAMDSAGTWSTNGKGCGYEKTCSPTYPVRGVCPEGWHLPNQTEWNALFAAIGGQSTAGQKLKAASGWISFSGITNEDAFGFSALPAGVRYSLGDYYYEGYYANFWSSTEYGSAYAYGMDLYYNGGNANLGDYDKYVGFSVRCVKD